MVATKKIRLTRIPKGSALGLTNAQARHLITLWLAQKTEKVNRGKKQNLLQSKHTISVGPGAGEPKIQFQRLRSLGQQKYASNRAPSRGR